MNEQDQSQSVGWKIFGGFLEGMFCGAKAAASIWEALEAQKETSLGSLWDTQNREELAQAAKGSAYPPRVTQSRYEWACRSLTLSEVDRFDYSTFRLAYCQAFFEYHPHLCSDPVEHKTRMEIFQVIYLCNVVIKARRNWLNMWPLMEAQMKTASHVKYQSYLTQSTYDSRYKWACRLLNLPKSSEFTQSEFQSAYRKAFRHYHPDLHTDSNEQEDRTLICQEIERSKAVIKSYRNWA